VGVGRGAITPSVKNLKPRPTLGCREDDDDDMMLESKLPEFEGLLE
jgi:hypothetical protein